MGNDWASLPRGEVQPIGGEVEGGEVIPAYPLQEDTFRLGVGGKRGKSAAILRLGRGRLFNTGEGGLPLREGGLPHLCPKGRDPSRRFQRKEEVLAIVQQAMHDGLHQRIMGIDQHVVGLEPIERQDKMDDCKAGTAVESVAKIEPEVGHLSGKRCFRP